MATVWGWRRRATVGALLAGLLTGLRTGGGTGGPGARRPRRAGDGAVVRWRPAPGTAWQWQLTGPLDLSVDVPVYELDGERTTAAEVAALHAAGRHVVCYVSAGSWEEFRPDAGRYPQEVLGERLDGFPDERWLDVRRLDVLAPLLRARLDVCRDKGFDAVEPDNVDGPANDSGFPLSAADSLGLRAVGRRRGARARHVGRAEERPRPGAASSSARSTSRSSRSARATTSARRWRRSSRPARRCSARSTAAPRDCGGPLAGRSGDGKHEDLDAFRLVCPAA